MDLPIARMTHIPSTIDFDETSLSSVPYLCQITVVMRMDLPLACMTYITSTMMKITIVFDEISSLSIGTYHRQKTVVMRMNLALARMTHIPSTVMKIIINLVDRPSKSTVINSLEKCDHSTQICHLLV